VKNGAIDDWEDGYGKIKWMGKKRKEKAISTTNDEQ
jgi:hypothetical protein